MIEIRALRPGDDRTRFRSGHPDLDRFFVRYAGQNQFRHHLGTTYIAVEGDAILGFATVCAAQVEPGALPPGRKGRSPGFPLPALRLARLAVAEGKRGHGIGQALVRFVFGLAHETAARIGCVGVVVDAKPEAAAFYAKLGFEPVSVSGGELGDRPVPATLFLALGSIPRQPGG